MHYVQKSNCFQHMVGRQCDLKMYVRNLEYPIPLQIGGPKTTFLTISQLDGNFSDLYLRNETRYRQWDKCVDNYTETYPPTTVGVRKLE